MVLKTWPAKLNMLIIFTSGKKMILEKINLKIEKLKTKIRQSFTKPILFDPDVLAYLGTLHRKYVIVLIDKVSNNFAFICKKFYISKILPEVGEYIQSNSVYSKANFSKDDIVENNENYCQKFDLGLRDEDCSLPIMYWLPNLHKTGVEARFIITSRNFSTKPLSVLISKFVKMLFKHVKIFIRRAHFIQVTKRSGLCRILFQLLKN